MRGLFITLDYPPNRGGVARYYEHLVRVLPPEHRMVLVHGFGARETSVDAHGVTITRQTLLGPSWLWPRWLRGFFVVRRFLRHGGIELLHVGNALPLGTIALLCKKFFGTPYIVYTHGLDIPLARSRWKRFLLRRVMMRAFGVVANSHYTLSQLINFGLPADRLIVVLPGCPRAAAVSTAELQKVQTLYRLKGTRVLLTVARLIPRKGIDLALRALSRLRMTTPNVRYLIVGTGEDLDRLQRIVREYGLQKHVVFCGAVSDTELSAYYSACDIFVMPARSSEEEGDVEGFGMVYLEANAHGKPVIAGKGGGVDDAVRHGVNGLVVDPRSVEAIRRALDQLLRDTAWSRRLGEQGRFIVEQDCSWEKRVQPLLAFLQKTQYTHLRERTPVR